MSVWPAADSPKKTNAVDVFQNPCASPEVQPRRGFWAVSGSCLATCSYPMVTQVTWSRLSALHLSIALLSDAKPVEGGLQIYGRKWRDVCHKSHPPLNSIWWLQASSLVHRTVSTFLSQFGVLETACRLYSGSYHLRKRTIQPV